MNHFKKNFKRACFYLMVGSLYVNVYAQTTNIKVECYTRSYDENHFNKPGNEKQSLQKINIKINDSSDEKYIEVDVWKRLDKDNKKFSANFSLVFKDKKHHVYCDTANGEGDGNQARGCLKVSNSNIDDQRKISRLISPHNYIFNDERGFNETEGVIFTNCNGVWNEGGECIKKGDQFILGEITELKLDVKNIADLSYRVEKTNCSRLN